MKVNRCKARNAIVRGCFLWPLITAVLLTRIQTARDDEAMDTDIASSSLFDLALQARPANVTVFMNWGNLAACEKFFEGGHCRTRRIQVVLPRKSGMQINHLPIADSHQGLNLRDLLFRGV